MWVLELVENGDVVQFDVQVLIHALQCAADGNIVFELDGDFVVDEGFEEAEEQHRGRLGEGDLIYYRRAIRMALGSSIRWMLCSKCRIDYLIK